MNNIETLTPECWFEECYGMKGGKNNDDDIWMPYHYKVTFLWAPAPSVSDLVWRQFREAVHKLPNSLHVFICPKLMMPGWGRLLINIDDLLEYGPTGKCFGHPQCTSCLFLVLFTLSSHTGLVGSGGHPRLWDWEGWCIYCFMRVKGMQGVLWENLGYS